MGVHVKILQELLGHTQASTTEGYNHISWEPMQKAIGKLNEYMQRKVHSVEEGNR